MSEIAAPFDAHRDIVRPEWIDHNQHMNVGYYLVVFDHATDAFLAWVGLDAEHRRQRAVTTFCLEAHLTYHREVRAGAPLRFTTPCWVTTPSACTTSMPCTMRRRAIWRPPTS